MKAQNLVGILKSRFATMDHGAFKAWAREHAVMLDPLDGADTDIEKLSVLDEPLKSKRVVYLGEPNHWIHEKYDFRLLLIRYLFSRGWRYLGEEMGWSDGVRVDRYLATGDPTHLDRVTICGYRGAWRTDRHDEPTGIIKDAWESYPEEEFRAEQIRFDKALRHLSATPPHKTERLHFFGFDVDYVPGGGYEELDEWLSSAQGDPVVTEIRRLLARVPGETLRQEIARLDRALEAIESQRMHLSKLLGRERYDQVLQSALGLRESFEYIRLANPATKWTALSEAFAARECVMRRQTEYVLSRLAPDDKVVLMSHNLHLTKDHASIRTPGPEAGPGGGRVPTIGEFVNRLLPEQVFSVWMLYDHGKDCQPFTGLSRQLRRVRGSLNAIFAEIGSAYLLPTATTDRRAARLLAAETRVVASMYNTVSRAAISKQADAIFFVREVSLLRP